MKSGCDLKARVRNINFHEKTLIWKTKKTKEHHLSLTGNQPPLIMPILSLYLSTLIRVETVLVVRISPSTIYSA